MFSDCLQGLLSPPYLVTQLLSSLLTWLWFASFSCCCCAEDRNLAETCAITPVLPLHLQSYTTSNQDYMTQLGCRIATALWEQKKERRGSKQRGEALPGGEGTELGSPSPSSGDGYFEMGLG